MKSLLLKFKNKKELPANSSCRNCGTELLARYCHNCGQDYFAGSEKTVGEILYNTVDTVFAWDNKILKTLKYLVFYPGKLTRDFFSGRVIQYVYPAKLFWFITILFFAAFNVGNRLNAYTDNLDKYIDDDKTVEVAVKDKPDLVSKDIPDEKPEDVSSAKKMSKEQMRRSMRQIEQNFVNYIPYIMFLLIPFFALLLFILFHKKKKHYASHMIFALHFHSFAFLFFTIYILIKDFIPETWENTAIGVLLFLPAIYLAIALYVAYRPNISKLIWKIPLIMLTYGIACLITLVLFVIVIMRMMEITQGIHLLDLD